MKSVTVDALDYAAARSGYRSKKRYSARCEFLFQNINLHGKRVLDVGCGRGTFALWAGMQGASYVLGIEPESSGSTEGTFVRFRETIGQLQLENVIEARSSFLSDIKVSDGRFDVAVLYNVINHLNEVAVVNLHRDESAALEYLDVLRHLRKILADGAFVIVSDCSRRNFWNDVGIRNPLAPTIEWNKHQSPPVWISIFRRAGFQLHDLRWSQLYPAGGLSSNWPVQYFSVSHFTLRFRAI